MFASIIYKHIFYICTQLYFIYFSGLITAADQPCPAGYTAIGSNTKLCFKALVGINAITGQICDKKEEGAIEHIDKPALKTYLESNFQGDICRYVS